MVTSGDCPGLLAGVSCVDHFRLSAGSLEPHTLRFIQAVRSRLSACLMPTAGPPWCPKRDESIATVNASLYVNFHMQHYSGLDLTILPYVLYSCPADLLATVSNSAQRSSTSFGPSRSRFTGLLNLQVAVCAKLWHIWSHGSAREPLPERGLIQLDLPALYKALPRLIDDHRCTQSAHKNRLPQVSYLARYLLFVLDSSLEAVIMPGGSCLCRLHTRTRHLELRLSGQQRFLNMCCPAL